ncbi:MAG TPA: AAA family ATPase [Bacilli bacterium]|nr:AAA family ATPase [Bacilli bacterium]
MNVNEKIAILFKRKPVNKRGEFVVIPFDFVNGVEEERNFVHGEVAYKNMSSYDSTESSIVYGFSIPIIKVAEALVAEGFIDVEEVDWSEENDNITSLILDFMDELLYNFKNYNIYQRIVDKNAKLSTHMFRKYIKNLETIDTRELPKTIIEGDMEFVFPSVDDDLINQREEAVLASDDAVKNNDKKLESKQPKVTTTTFMPEIKRTPTFIDVKELYQTVLMYVIGQDEQVKRIVSAIAQNQIINNPAAKQNILVAGPTGVGKTEIFRVISKYLNLPLVTADATEYTMAGYEGKSVGEMLVSLYKSAGNDEKKAARGILVVDEIDKLAGGDSNEKVSTTGVLESLLKIMEGGINTFKNQYTQVSIDTSFVTFVGLGAFSNMDKMVIKREVGFAKEAPTIKEKFSTDNFEKYGMLPEFVGRCNTRVIMNSLDCDCLKRILLEARTSQLLLKAELLNEYGVKLNCSPKAIDSIALAALNKKTGARGLATVVSEMLSEALFEVQCNPGKYSSLQIFEETVTDNTKYELHAPVRKIKR